MNIKRWKTKEDGQTTDTLHLFRNRTIGSLNVLQDNSIGGGLCGCQVKMNPVSFYYIIAEMHFHWFVELGLGFLKRTLGILNA